MVTLYLQSQGFKQIVRKATHISGSLLDHPLWCFKGPSFNMFNSLYCPPVASEVGSDVAQAPLRDQMANVISVFFVQRCLINGVPMGPIFNCLMASSGLQWPQRSDPM